MATEVANEVTPQGQGQKIEVKTRSKYVIEDSIINHELRRKLWDGMLPLKINMNIDDLLHEKEPSALYVRYSQLTGFRLWLLGKTIFTTSLRRLKPCLTLTPRQTKFTNTMKCGFRSTISR